ncbi:hypothetical protein E2C01_079741 [Portunus trituberculatus]|uniref:Uncharacterized protein n=1 Tax=Portunus trituberculatus TaxID=210409 RepID=A0A5B7IXT3_PORTR|nr:hypothetical protein [Portunus trituberculatus]
MHHNTVFVLISSCTVPVSSIFYSLLCPVTYFSLQYTVSVPFSCTMYRITVSVLVSSCTVPVSFTFIPYRALYPNFSLQCTVSVPYRALFPLVSLPSL